LSLIRELRDRGLAIVLVNRRMPDVFSVAGRIVVLRKGMVADRQIAVFGKSPRWASSWGLLHVQIFPTLSSSPCRHFAHPRRKAADG
jgi:energy-coupling factor transporter ATP-binding protein EcfA2